jgi:hypothetical protein
MFKITHQIFFNRLFCTFAAILKISIMERIEQIAQQGKNILYRKWLKSWSNGRPFRYRDERTKIMGDIYAVQANPDGSEDLVMMSYDGNRTYFRVIKPLCGKWNGKYSFLLHQLPENRA